MGGKKEWEGHHRQAPQGGASIPAHLSARQRKIIYRCKQRGWLELDILLGSWAVKHVPGLREDDTALRDLECILDADTPDVLKWVLGHADPPSRFDNRVLHNIRAYALGGQQSSS